MRDDGISSVTMSVPGGESVTLTGDEFHRRAQQIIDRGGRAVDEETGEVADGDICVFRARLKGTGGVKPDKDGFVSIDVTFTLFGGREQVETLVRPIHGLMARTKLSDVLQVEVTPAIQQGRLL